MNKAVFFLICAILPLLLAYLIKIRYDLLICSLCIYEQMVFFVIVLLSAILYKLNHKAILVLIILMFFVGALLALYHIGVENGILSSKCVVKKTLDDASIYDQLLYTDFTSCADKFILFGFSIPAWNFFYCIGVVFVYFLLKVYKNGVFFKK